MSVIQQRIGHNISILWISIIIILAMLMVWFNDQTASLTDVLNTEEVRSNADMVLEYWADWILTLSTLKEYDNIEWATLRISFFIEKDQQEQFEKGIQSSYWFFVTNHNNTSIVTLYLPSLLTENTVLLRFNNDLSKNILDSIILFQEENTDEIRVEQKLSRQFHE